MFETNNLNDEKMLADRRHRLYGKRPLIDQHIDHALFSGSKGTIYLMAGASKIFKIYPRLTEKPHNSFAHCIVGVKGSEHLSRTDVRAMDTIDHVPETEVGGKVFNYSQLVIHTKSGQCFILCQDPLFLKTGHARLQIEEADRYPPNDAKPLEDFQLPLPYRRIKND